MTSDTPVRRKPSTKSGAAVMNPVILFGACAGAGTSTAALRAIQDEARSKVPVLGYTVPYALGNILLTAWGPVIVLLTR